MLVRCLVLSMGVGVVATFAGCKADSSSGVAVDDITPRDPKNLWELAELCDGNITRHLAVRDQELSAGIVRWQCGDRDGVDGDEDRGQEYCEYMAVSEGKRVRSASQATPGKPLYCFFSSVYSDVDGGGTTLGDVDRGLATSLSTAENLDASVDAALVRMKGRFNSRAAATTLITDSIHLSRALRTPDDKRYERTAACYVAAKGGDANRQSRIRDACAGKDLALDGAWKAATDLGVEVASAGALAYEEQRTMYACMSVRRLDNGGVSWRLSDPHITQIIVRASLECGCQYDALPLSLPGFLQGTWSSPTGLPPGCRRAKLKDGTESEQLTICEVTPQRLAELVNDFDYGENLGRFCNETFGRDIVLTAPVRAVEKAGTCTQREASDFCRAWTRGAR